MAWLALAVLLAISMGLAEVAWSALMAVAAFRGSIHQYQRSSRALWSRAVLALVFFGNNLLAGPMAVVSKTLSGLDIHRITAEFLWSPPSLQLVTPTQVLLFAIDAVVMAIGVGAFSLTLLDVIHVREVGYDPIVEELGPPTLRTAWLRWAWKFGLTVAIHAWVTPDGIIISVAMVGAATFSFGITTWLELWRWRENEKRASNLAKGGPTRLGTPMGRRRIVVGHIAAFLAGSAPSLAVLAVLYGGSITTTTVESFTRIGMVLFACIYSTILALADLVTGRAFTVLYYGYPNDNNGRSGQR